MYGEIPGGGGFGNNTEYEVAASNMAEAAHCILGSLAKLTDDTPFRIEKGHIKEEMGIIEHAMREYSKDLYLMRTFSGDYAVKTIKDVLKIAPALEKKAKSAKSRLDKNNVLQIKNLAEAAYDFLILLGQKMYISAKRLNVKLKMDGDPQAKNPVEASKLNAYKDKELISSVKKLRKRVDIFLKLPD
jgi:hypothetical protein